MHALIPLFLVLCFVQERTRLAAAVSEAVAGTEARLNHDREVARTAGCKCVMRFIERVRAL